MDPIVLALATLAIGLGVAVLLGRLLARVVGGVSTPERATLAGRIGLWGTASLAAATALGQVGIVLSVFLGAAGLFTVAIGFAAQTSASNFISGLFLVAERPFSVGDFVRINTIEGVVLAVDFLSVKLATPDNLYVRVPNETVMKSDLVNYTRHPVRRIQLVLQVPFAADLSQVEAILVEAADAMPFILDEPRPAAFFLRYAESGVEIQFNAWAPTTGFIKSKRELGQAALEALRANGIEVPFPHVRLLQ